MQGAPWLVELVGVYHADGGVLGEVRYVAGKLRGTAHCALCDVTHGPVRRKQAWDAYQARLDVPFTLVHLNEMPDDVARAVAEAGSPVVLGRTTGDDLVTLLDGAALDAVGGDVDAFAAAVESAVVGHVGA